MITNDIKGEPENLEKATKYGSYKPKPDGQYLWENILTLETKLANSNEDSAVEVIEKVKYTNKNQKTDKIPNKSEVFKCGLCESKYATERKKFFRSIWTLSTIWIKIVFKVQWFF